MKTQTQHRRVPRTLLAAVALLAGLATAPALTVPVAQDTYSLPTGKVAVANGKAVSLPVNAKQTSLLRFDLSDTAVVPQAIQPGNIQSATLRLFVVSAKPAGIVTVRAVSSTWKEQFTGAPVVLPTVAPTILATIPAGEILPKTFITVDVTNAVKAALDTGNDFGFALQCVDPAARVIFSSKEGAATGYAAELEIVANTAAADNGDIEANLLTATSISAGSGIFSGTLGAVDTTLTGKLTIGSTFIVEPRPNNSAGNSATFIGEGAGLSNTTGAGNIFIGTSAGSSNITGSQDTYVGVGAGFNANAGFNSLFGFNSGNGLSSGTANTCMGWNSGAQLATGFSNVLLGHSAGLGAKGNLNVMIGASSGQGATAGNQNVYIGASSAGLSSAGNSNVLIGYNAGLNNAANENVYIGEGAGKTSFSGVHNVYVGFNAATAATTGNDNLVIGWRAGLTMTNASQNTFLGVNAGKATTTGANSFVGAGAGEFNSTGFRVTSIGNEAGRTNTTGNNNTYLGEGTGESMSTESNNTFVGQNADGAAGVTNSTAIGQGSKVNASNTVILGNNCNVGIRNSAPNSALQVSGSLSLPIRINNGPLTSLDETDHVLINQGTNTGVLLPSATVTTGRIYIIKNRAATALTIGTSPPTQLIDNATTLVVPANTMVQLISSGAQWFRIDQ